MSVGQAEVVPAGAGGKARRMTELEPDTVFAPASGLGRAAIAVIRLSGPRCGAVLERLAGPLPSPRRLSLRALRDPADGGLLDQALVAWMPGPHTFTGEDQAELHIHGGPAVRAAVLGALGREAGCRPAEAGEFTRRAFLSGKLGLDRVEGLADLIDAETEVQRRQGLRQLEGHLGTLVEGWRERLLEASALLEAALDFSDEGDVAADVEAHAARIVQDLVTMIAAHLGDGRRGERLREGLHVVLAGEPNAGKSTLLNALARRDVALVSPQAGTTRDAIEVRCDLDGLPVTFVDTAGLRDTADPVEREGVRRARTHIERADLVLALHPPGGGEPALPADGPAVLRVGTMSDLPGAAWPAVDLTLSARTGEGLDELLRRVTGFAAERLGAGDAVLTRERHRLALERAAEALGRSSRRLDEGGAELAAEDVRLALRALGQITGRVDVEEVLDRLFAGFCIGK